MLHNLHPPFRSNHIFDIKKGYKITFSGICLHSQYDPRTIVTFGKAKMIQENTFGKVNYIGDSTFGTNP